MFRVKRANWELIKVKLKSSSNFSITFQNPPMKKNGELKWEFLLKTFTYEYEGGGKATKVAKKKILFDD